MLQPSYVNFQFITSFINIVMTRLNPLQPITLRKPRWHNLNTLLPYELLKSSHTAELEIGYVIPAKVDPAIVLGGFILCDFTMPIRYEKVGFIRGQIMRVLFVVAGMVGVFTIWRLDRLFELLKVLIIGPLDIKIVHFMRHTRHYSFIF